MKRSEILKRVLMTLVIAVAVPLVMTGCKKKADEPEKAAETTTEEAAETTTEEAADTD